MASSAPPSDRSRWSSTPRDAQGIVVGIGVGFLIHVLSHFSFAVPLWGMLLGFFSSTVIGLFFGIYPAVKAAQLDPVDSLRYE